MNTSNQKLLKGIKIFFKAVYIIMFVFLGLIVLSFFLLLFGEKEQVSLLTMYFSIHNPNVSLTIGGNTIQPEIIYGIGGIIAKQIPAGLNIVNMALPLISLILYFFIIKYIRSIIKSIDNSELFSLINARRLRNIGFILLIDLVVNYSVVLFNSISTQNLDSFSLGSLIGYMFSETTMSIVAIVFTFFIAAIFKIGVNMQEENKSFV